MRYYKIIRIFILCVCLILLIIMISPVIEYKETECWECLICRSRKYITRYCIISPKLLTLKEKKEERDDITGFTVWYNKNIEKNHVHKWKLVEKATYTFTLDGIPSRISANYLLRKVPGFEERRYLETHFSNYKDMREFIYRMVEDEKEVEKIIRWKDELYKKGKYFEIME